MKPDLTGNPATQRPTALKSERLCTDMSEVASIIFAAGRGTRMTGYSGNKTLLPLIPERSLYDGSRPLIMEVIYNLPAGPKGIVVNHCAEDVQRITEGPGISYIYQPVTNGTGGALIAARSFLESADAERAIITMGDVPLIRAVTYGRLMALLDCCALALLAFEPGDKAQYGMLETDGDRVSGITEWKYWKDFPIERRNRLRYCNAGVYAARRADLIRYVERLEKMPHEVRKHHNGEWITMKEYFLTDLAGMMNEDGLQVRLTVAPEEEVNGVDNPESLKTVQALYAGLMSLE